jgi:uroporphyrinogen III methyltransferase/synthase
MDVSEQPRVALVGAGPGDPGLLTLRGRALLELAEVVIYDALANPRLLSYCPAGCEQIYVGKRAARHALSQDQINALLVEKARSGKRVVRLKGGDPFVFGRGGEEAEALAAAGIAFEIVPGITAAIAAPAYAGIPVTHRDFNSSFTLITGHEKEDESAAVSDLDWSALAKLPCLAFYMGAKALPRICAKLTEHGMAPDTPAATIQWGTTPRQRTVVGTISELPQTVEAAGIGAPAITIVGRVVSLRQTINWFETRPLFGQTIVVTRTRQQASELSAKLEALGANVIEAPTIELVPPANWDEVDAALAAGGGWDWVVFTSANGVRFTRDRLGALGRDARVFGDARIAAIGDATAKAIGEQLGLHVELCPQSFVAEALADALERAGQVRGKRFLLLRADIARPVLRQRLEAGGAAIVRDVAIYQTTLAPSLPEELIESLAEKRVNWATFTSSSTARNFAELLGKDYAEKLAGVKLASIGPITTATLRELGLAPSVEATHHNIDGVVEAILASDRAPR